MLRMFLVFRY